MIVPTNHHVEVVFSSRESGVNLVVQWLSYLFVFVVGSTVSWVVVVLSIKRAGDNQERQEAPAEVPDLNEMGAR